MYNYQQFQRQQLLKNECSRTYNQFLNENNNRKSINKTLYSNHKKRIDAFVLSAIQSPIQIVQHRSCVYDPRSVLKSVKPITSFKMNSHTASQRLKSVVEKNQYLDPVPFRNSSLHKFRESAHEKPLKFTASCTAVRLMENYILARTNEIEGFQPRNDKNVMRLRHALDKFEKQSRKIVKQQNKDLQSQNQVQQKNKPFKIRIEMKPNKYLKQLQRVIMPNLHRKAYLNSMKSLLVEASTKTLTESSQSQKQVGDKHVNIDQWQSGKQNENQKDNKGLKMKNKPSEQLNRKENAINAMIKCKLLRSHNGVFQESSLRY